MQDLQRVEIVEVDALDRSKRHREGHSDPIAQNLIESVTRSRSEMPHRGTPRARS